MPVLCDMLFVVVESILRSNSYLDSVSPSQPSAGCDSHTSSHILARHSAGSSQQMPFHAAYHSPLTSSIEHATDYGHEESPNAFRITRGQLVKIFSHHQKKQMPNKTEETVSLEIEK